MDDGGVRAGESFLRLLPGRAAGDSPRRLIWIDDPPG